MMNDKVLTLRGNKAVWAPAGGGSGPIDPKRLPEGYPYKEGRATVDMSAVLGPEAVLCKVSDKPPVNASGMQSIKIWADGGIGSSVEVAISNEMGLVDVNLSCVVACVDNATFDLEGLMLTMPEKGVYFLKSDAICVTGVAWDTSATEPVITWDGQSETIHPMAPEFPPALTSPNGTKYQLTVADDGTLSAVAVS